MPAVARMAGVDKVFSPHGTGKKCKFPTTQYTLDGSSRVFAMGVGVVRQGDTMSPHPQPGCIIHTLPLTSCSSRVFADGIGVGRIGDNYGEHPIISGAPRVFAS